MASSNFDRTESSSLRAGVSGGLNTADSDLLTPLEDSPDMVNTQVDFDGMVRKRKGYKILGLRSSGVNVRAGFMCALQTVTGRPFIIRREGSSLVTDFKDDTGWIIAHKTLVNVFGTLGANENLDHITLNESAFNRVIMVSPSQVPIQYGYSSYALSFVKAGGSATFTNIPVPASFLGCPTADLNSLIFLVNGVAQTIAAPNTVAFSNNSATITVTVSNVFSAGTYNLELMANTWQWWAESIQLFGSQFQQTVVQGTSTQTISVPSALLQGIEPYSEQQQPLLAFSSTQYDAVFAKVNPPTTSSQYIPSNGAIKDGTSTPLPLSPFFLAFGATPASVRNVHIQRGYLLPFFGGSGVNLTANSLDVTPIFRSSVALRSTTAPPSEGGAGTGTVGVVGFHLRNRTTFLVLTSTAAGRVPTYITLDGSSTATGGLALIAFADIFQITDVYPADTIATGALGSGAVAGTSIARYAKNFPPEFPPVPVITYAYPIAGISWFSDYKRTSHPGAIGTIQGRIAIGGFKDKPMTLVCSNSYDSIAPGFFANNFDVVYSLPSATSPFDLTLPGKSNDKITALQEFNDSLFVFTLNQVFRVHNNGNVIDVTNAKYSVIADIGATNPRCVTNTDKYPVFLSTSGVYAIVPNDSAAGYGVQELSSKVRNYIQNRVKTLTYTGFVNYDASRNELYVGLSDNTSLDRCGDMLVYNTRLDAWYKYTSRGGAGFQASLCFTLSETTEANPNPLSSILFMLPGGFNDPDNIKMVEMNTDSMPIDLEQSVVWSGGTLPLTTTLVALEVTVVSIVSQLEFDPSDVATYKEKAFKLSPIRELQDVEVALNGVTQTFNVDYIKTNRGTILFTSGITPGTSVRMRKRILYQGVLYYPVSMWNSSNSKLYQPNELTVDISGDVYRITAVSGAPTNGNTVYVGYCFSSWYTTPTFNRGTLNVKRIKEYIGYYQNNVVDIWNSNELFPTGASIGRRKVPLNVDIACLFSGEYEGLIATDLFPNLTPSLYPNQQTKDYARVSVPIVGGGYNIQLIHHNNTPTTFKLAGYELKAVPKKGKGYSKSEEYQN